MAVDDGTTKCRRPELAGLVAILLVALALRLAFWFALPNVAHPDEIFQNLEQAGRLVFGRGYVPWEYQIGARSWLLPGLIAPFLALASTLSDRPDVFIGALHVGLILLSCAVLVAAWSLGRWLSPAAGLWAAALNAIWLENLYFAPHLLPDTLSATLLILGIAASPRPGVERALSYLLAGLILGLAFVVRIQLGFAVATALLTIGGLVVRRYWFLTIGFAIPLLALGLADWITWGAPFYSVYVYILTNTSGVADLFGDAPFTFYLTLTTQHWLLATPLLVLTIWLGARRLPSLAAVAAAVVLTFSCVPHKEYRFVYPALPLLLTLAGIGTAELLAWVRQRWMPAAAAALWLAMSVQLGLSYDLRQLFQHDADLLRAYAVVNADPTACGVGIVSPPVWHNLNLTALRADLQFYTTDRENLSHQASAFNYIFAFRRTEQDNSLGFQDVFCGHNNNVCVTKRPGTCHSDAATPRPSVQTDIAEVLARIGLHAK
jgi:hypothetical protein